MRRYAGVLVCILCIPASILADIYLHSPRGSNNRLNEKSANRNNANRMFDSQNNNRGGYNVGDKDSQPAGNNVLNQYNMKYFQSSSTGSESIMHIEWTNQHGCGGSEDGDPHKQNCNLVMQFMCQEESVLQSSNEKIRNGVNTQTINYQPKNNIAQETVNQRNNRKNNAINDKSRGLAESWEFYDNCYNRERNKGLFTADQKLKTANANKVSGAIYTRQNPNGNRYGLECPEERDYYPYWHPTPWMDISVMTDNVSMCQWYKKESFSSRQYGECVEYYPNTNIRKHYSVWNNPEKCADEGGRWVQFSSYLEKAPEKTNKQACESSSNPMARYVWAVPYDATDVTKEECLVAVPELDCQQAPWSRSNHLGNGREPEANSYSWVLPYFPSGKEMRCNFRFRYNISTDDYNPWTINSSFNANLQTGVQSPVEQNPYVNIGAKAQALRLAINTAQFGRTFQDRSHNFLLSPRPESLKNGKIYNVNVRGKRGNIVQVYPAVEYDFAPTNLEMREDDLVHFQWTGSNTHNNGNPGGDGQTGDAGEGQTGTDRNNVVQIADMGENFPLPYEQTTMWNNAEIKWIPYSLQGNKSPSKEDLALYMASSGYYRCMKQSDCNVQSVDSKASLNNLLNNAPASMLGAVLKFNKGTYNYTCTRNNNFSNRSQKASIIVT